VNGKTAVWFLAMFVWTCEIMGGMTSVALTDAIQCSILLLTLTVMPMVVANYWGGVEGLGGPHCSNYHTIKTMWPDAPPKFGSTTVVMDPAYSGDALHGGYTGPGDYYSKNGTTMAFSNTIGGTPNPPPSMARRLEEDDTEGSRGSQLIVGVSDAVMTSSDPKVKFGWTVFNDQGNHPWAYNLTETGCLYYNKPKFYQYPPRKLVLNFMYSIAILFWPFCLSPVVIHRAMIARSDESLRFGLSMVHLFPLWFLLPSMLNGWVSVAIIPDSDRAPLMALCFYFLDEGGFAAFITIMMLCSCIASFMSTADSIVLAVSNQFIMDYFIPVFPNASQHMCLLSGKLSSLVCIVTGVSIALYTDVHFVQLLSFGWGALWALIPAWTSLWVNQSSIPVNVGILVGWICGNLMFEAKTEGFNGGDIYFLSGIWTGIFSGMICFLTHHILKLVWPAALDDDNKVFKWDQIDSVITSAWGDGSGKRLTTEMIGKIMQDTSEVWDTKIGTIWWLWCLFSVHLSLPWYATHANSYTTWGPEQEIWGGWPKWAAIMLMTQALSSVGIIISTFFWQNPPLTPVGKEVQRSALGDFIDEWRPKCATKGPPRIPHGSTMPDLGLNGCNIGKLGADKQDVKLSQVMPAQVMPTDRAAEAANPTKGHSVSKPTPPLPGAVPDDMEEVMLS